MKKIISLIGLFVLFLVISPRALAGTGQAIPGTPPTCSDGLSNCGKVYDIVVALDDCTLVSGSCQDTAPDPTPSLPGYNILKSPIVGSFSYSLGKITDGKVFGVACSPYPSMSGSCTFPANAVYAGSLSVVAFTSGNPQGSISGGGSYVLTACSQNANNTSYTPTAQGVCTAAGGTIVVNSVDSNNNPLPSSWTLTGPATLPGSGTSQTYPSKPTGAYTISPTPPSGYVLNSVAPAVSQTLSSGGTITFNIIWEPTQPQPPACQYPATAQVGTPVTFQGSAGSSNTYNWLVTNGTASPTTGSNESNFATTFSQPDAAAQVKLTDSAGNSTNCNITITSSGGAPGGIISADPDPCSIVPPASMCNSNITWSTSGVVTAAEIYVSKNGVENPLEFQGSLSGIASATFIGLGNNYVFNLYDDSTGVRGMLLDSVAVTATSTAPPCGENAQACCSTGSSQCDPGNACQTQGNVCEYCGGAGELCCTTSPSCNANSGLSCQSNGLCEPVPVCSPGSSAVQVGTQATLQGSSGSSNTYNWSVTNGTASPSSGSNENSFSTTFSQPDSAAQVKLTDATGQSATCSVNVLPNSCGGANQSCCSGVGCGSGLACNSGLCTYVPTLTISPSSASVAVGKLVSFTAMYDSDGIGPAAPVQVTANTSWSSDTNSIATMVTPTGTAKGLVPGTANILATYQGVIAPSASLTVTNGGGSGSNFTVTAIPNSEPIGQNSSGVFTVSVNSPNGFTGTVTLTSGFPPGNPPITGIFNPTTVTLSSLNPSQQSTFTVTVPATQATGTVPITITGTSPTFSTSTTPTITVTGSGGSSPTLRILPTNTSVVVNQKTQFVAWYDSDGSGSKAPTPVTNLTTWLSLSPLIATMVTPTGTAQGKASGATTIQATYNGLQATADLNVTSNSSPDFTVLRQPESNSIAQGTSGNYTVWINPTNGFSDSVDLSISSGLPNNITWKFSPSKIVSPQQSILTLTVASNATLDTDTFTVTGKDDKSTLTHTETADVVVTPYVTPVISVLSVTPNQGSGLSQSFTATYSDTAGAQDISEVELSFETSTNNSQAYTSGCNIAYIKNTNTLNLVDDLGNLQAIGNPGVDNKSLSNGQCTVSDSGASVTALPGSNVFSLNNVSTTFNTNWAGDKQDWLEANNGTQSSTWIQKGKWTVPSVTLGWSCGINACTSEVPNGSYLDQGSCQNNCPGSCGGAGQACCLPGRSCNGSLTCSGGGGGLCGSPLSISAAPNPVSVGQLVTASSSGGTAPYTWSAVGMSNQNQQGNILQGTYDNPGPSYPIVVRSTDGRTASLNMEVIAPWCSFSASPTPIVLPASSTLSWLCNDVVTCSIDNGVGSVNPPKTSTVVFPTQPTTYLLTCKGPGPGSLPANTFTVSTTIDTVGPNGIIEVPPGSH